MTTGSVQQPAQWDLSVYQGDTFDLRLTMTADGSPIDLSAANVLAQVRTKQSVTPIDFTVVEKRADGFLHLRLAAGATQNITGGMWDLQIELGGIVRTYLRGRVTAAKDVAR